MQSREFTPWAPPILRWAGSKRRLIPTLMGSMPRSFARYIEPFAGSACLFFAIHPPSAVLGDINAELMRAYSVVRRHPRQIARLARSWPTTKSHYYSLRATPPDSLDAISRAARFIYLNRNCFNGVYRVNRQNQFNVPQGVRTGQMPGEHLFYRCSVALRGVKLITGDFQGIISEVKDNDFVYLDPPYAVQQRPTHGEYGYGSFDRLDLPRLNESLTAIDKKGATFLLSYAHGNNTGLELSPWFVKRIRVLRHVSGFACHRRSVYEVLVSNRPLAQHAA